MADSAGTAAATTSLAAFERLVFSGDFPAAMAMLLGMLDAIERGADVPDGFAGDDGLRRYCTRFAAAVATLFASDRNVLSPKVIDRLAFHSRHITAIFRLSGYADPGYPYGLVRNLFQDSRDQATVARILAVASVAAPGEINWEGLLRQHIGTVSSAFLANFSHRSPLTLEAEARRNALLELAPLLETHSLRPSQLPLLCQAWMFCSYLTAPERHTLKRSLNRLVSEALARAGIVSLPQPTEREFVDRPTIVVVAEVMISWHAMFKTYANFLKQLRKRFRTVLVTLKGRIDEPAREPFEETIEIDDTPDALAAIVTRIGEIAPALLYYPSVGMSALTVQLCNLRLAPIQVASVGHPATTHSPAIDYMAMGHSYYAEEARFSESVLLLQSTGALFEPTLGANLPAPQIREAPDRLRIAVSSSTLKLNASFLSVCREIESAAKRPLEFHIFPNETGIRHRDCAVCVREYLPEAIVHPRVGYDAYLERLNACDLRLGTFPFGGANTTMDSYLLGIPTVTLLGAEPHSRTDGRFVSLFGLPEWLAARDTAAYRAAALRLTGDDGERVRLSRYILDSEPARVLFEKEQNAFASDFADTLWWAYRHHETIRSQDRRVWHAADRIAMEGSAE